MPTHSALRVVCSVLMHTNTMVTSTKRMDSTSAENSHASFLKNTSAVHSATAGQRQLPWRNGTETGRTEEDGEAEGVVHRGGAQEGRVGERDGLLCLLDGVSAARSQLRRKQTFLLANTTEEMSSLAFEASGVTINDT